MQIRKIFPLLLVLFGFFVGYFGSQCAVESKCGLYAQTYGYLFTFLIPLKLFTLYALPGAIFAVFARKEIFKTWLRYSFFWALFSAILIYKIPVYTGDWLSYWWLEKHSIAQFCGILFSAIGLLVIGVKTIQLKRKKR